ncbi:MAG: hypothetical protein GQ557_00850 [Mycoplasmataceae bacterium]|nr:hypothetical protein [Mycoplasmataceae bacterium]
MIDYLKNIYRMLTSWYILPVGLWTGSRRENKWLKKNRREQDPNLNPYEQRWEHIKKKVKKSTRRIGATIELVNEENLPNGAAWITPNHTSNFDPFYLIKAMGGRINLIPIAKKKLEDSKLASGYIRGADGFFIDRSKLREQIVLLNGAAQLAKNTNRAVTIFPEGTRSFTSELLSFKDGSFKFAQRYYLPIVPITITGTLQARPYFRLKTAHIKVIVHKPIKASEHMKLPTEIVSKRVFETIQRELRNYEDGLSIKEKAKLEKLKIKARKLEVKKNIKLNKELGI